MSKDAGVAAESDFKHRCNRWSIHRTKKWKEKLREGCLQRMSRDRWQLLQQMRKGAGGEGIAGKDQSMTEEGHFGPTKHETNATASTIGRGSESERDALVRRIIAEQMLELGDREPSGEEGEEEEDKGEETREAETEFQSKGREWQHRQQKCHQYEDQVMGEFNVDWDNETESNSLDGRKIEGGNGKTGRKKRWGVICLSEDGEMGGADDMPDEEYQALLLEMEAALHSDIEWEMRKIEAELVQKELVRIDAYEDAAIEAAVQEQGEVILGDGDVLCPICRCWKLLQQVRIIFCPCGRLRLNTQVDQVNLAFVKQRLSEVWAFHLHSSCHGSSLHFFQEKRFDVTALYASCGECGLLELVL